jgi:hypothetical protein
VTIKAISLWQPWASLAACGAKSIETRGWSPSYRGPLAIHAAKRVLTNDFLYSLLHDKTFVQAYLKVGLTELSGMRRLPRGVILATCTLADCVRTEDVPAIGWKERAFGDYSPGRWAWLLTNIKMLPEPIPCVGRQGLFNVEIAA